MCSIGTFIYIVLRGVIVSYQECYAVHVYTFYKFGSCSLKRALYIFTRL